MAFQRTIMNAGLVALLGFITVCPLACGQAAPPPQITWASNPPPGQTSPYKGPFPCPFPSGETVVFSDPDAPDATIFFTTKPATEAAQVMAGNELTPPFQPIQINQAGPVTLTAVAQSPHYPQRSPLATWKFNCPRTTPPPLITGLSSPPAGQNPPYTGNLPCPVPNGTTVLPQQVTMLDPDTAAVIFFTFVPNAIPNPNAAGTVIYGGSFLMNQTGAVTLTAVAQAPNYPQSASAKWTFNNCPFVLPPTFSPPQTATAVCPLHVTINTNNTQWGSGVFVTTNGTPPSSQQNNQLAGNLTGQVAVTVPVTSKGIPNQPTITTLGAISCIANGLYCSLPVLNQQYTCPGPPPSFDRMNITIGTGNDQLKSGTELTGTLTTAAGPAQNICLHPSEQLPPDNFCPNNGSTPANNQTNNTWSTFNTPVSENVNVATAQALTNNFQTLTLTMNEYNGCGIGANNWALQSIKVQVWDSKSRNTTTNKILDISELQSSSNANNCFVHLKCNSPGNTITFKLDGNGSNPQPKPVCNQGGP
jgi:hypothetical protein